MSLANAFEMPVHSSSENDGPRHSQSEGKLCAATTSSSLARGDGALSSGESTLSSSSSTYNTLLGLHTPRARSFLSRNSAPYNSKQSVEEIDLEDFDGNSERMESLVSGLLQDEGQEYQSGAAKVPLRGSRNGLINSPGSSLQRVNDLRMSEENNYVGIQCSHGCDYISLCRSLSAGGLRFPLAEGVPQNACSDTFVKDQIQLEKDQVHLAEKANDIGLFLQASISTEDDNLNLKYFFDSGTARGGSMNPSVQMTLSTSRGHEHAGARKFNAMNDRKSGSPGRSAPNAHLMKTRNERPDHANETGRLLKYENLVSELRMTGANIELGARAQSNSSETPSDALGTICSLPREKICITSADSEAELRKVEKKVEEICRRGLYNRRMCFGPATSTFDASITNNFSSTRTAKARGNSSFASAAPVTHYSVPVGLRSPMSAQYAGQGHTANTANVQSSSLGSTTEKQPSATHRYRMLTAGPPKRIFPSDNRARAVVKATRASGNEFYPKFNTRVSPRTPPRASQLPGGAPPIWPNSHQKDGIAVMSTTSSVFKLHDHDQALSLTKQRSAAYQDERLAVFPAAHAGRKINVNPSRHHENAPAKLFIARGAKSISILLKSEDLPVSVDKNSAARLGAPSITPKDSPPPSRARHQQKNLQDQGSSSQLIPIQHPPVELDVCNQGQLKTELCNNWQEAKFCPYGENCRFAHGMEELRCVLRHPRYKTIPCRMIMNGKACIYGHRCHFRHSLTTDELSLISVLDVHSPTIRQGQSIITSMA